MSQSVSMPAEKHINAPFGARARQFVTGLAEDFWKDTPLPPGFFARFVPAFLRGLLAKKPAVAAKVAAPASKVAAAAKPAVARARKASLPVWHAGPGEVAEKLWGPGFVLPAGGAVAELLVKPLGIKPEMSLLDLSAGLGGMARRLGGQVQLTSMESDPALAARGSKLLREGGDKGPEISSFDPATFALPPTFDFALARELFYQLKDRPAFFTALADCLKAGGQIAFTDYIVDPENRKKPAILDWQKHEKDAAPLGLIEMAQAWAKAGFKISASDDETPLYKREILAGMKRLVLFLRDGGKPDAETKKLVLREIELWARRLAAFEQGMKFYRFHAARQG